MADKRINQYQTKNVYNLDDVLAVAKNNTTMKISAKDFIEVLRNGKLVDNFNPENAGYVLAVGEDGLITLVEPTDDL